MCLFHINVQYNHIPKDFVCVCGGGEILREINGQDHQTSMASIIVSICSIWSWSLRSSEGIGKQHSIVIVYGINNTSSKIKKEYNAMSFRTDHASAHSA